MARPKVHERFPFNFHRTTVVPSVLTCLFMPLMAVAASLPQNITITVPNGTSNHGDPHLLCIPTKAIDVAFFFLVNYVAHAATINSSPGEHLIPTIVRILFALAFPVSGIIRGLRGIYQAAIFIKDPLQAALTADALCEVVRTKYWQPKDGDEVRIRLVRRDEDESQKLRLLNISSRHGLTREAREIRDQSAHTYQPLNVGDSIEMEQNRPKPNQDGDVVVGDIQDPNKFFIDEVPLFNPASGWANITRFKVHSVCILPPGYALSIVAVGANIGPSIHKLRSNTDGTFSVPKPPGKHKASSFAISSTYSASKGLIAILQLVYGSYTIY
jgi:hypothetical protein